MHVLRAATILPVLFLGSFNLTACTNFEGFLEGLSLLVDVADYAEASKEYDKGNKAYDEGDYETALNYFKKAAAKGHLGAQVDIGWMYEEGLGVKQDDEQAVHWYEKAAKQGSAGGQYNLGWMYENGRGLKQDDKEAYYWYLLAAAGGFVDALKALLPLEERLTAAQIATVHDWVATHGDVNTHFGLGGIYEQGEGVARDNKKAYFWYLLAAGGGSEKAAKAAANVEERLSAREMRAVRNSAEVWQAKQD
jgi:TPR repeat protein